MIRTFVAIDLPTDIKQSLASPIERLKSRNPAVRWVRPDAMHITLKFLGDIPEDAVGPVSADLDEISAVTSPLRLGLSGFGAFPGVHRPRVVWVGVTGDTVRLADLARRVDEACARHGVKRERRPFTGHITLGRLRQPSVVDLRIEPVPSVFEATEIILYRSDLSPSGARYTALHASRLKA